jgi:predicted transposase YdaD
MGVSGGITGKRIPKSCPPTEQPMSQTFDATLKNLLELDCAGWPALINLPPRPSTIIDADISTVSAATDKVIRRFDPDELIALDFQAGPFAGLPRRTCKYNRLLADRHGLTVRSVIVLLRPEANLTEITGLYTETHPGAEKPYLQFEYVVVRVWQLPVQQLLTGSIGLLPLAPIAQVERAALPSVLHQMQQRLATAEAEVRQTVWVSAYILSGLRYNEAVSEQLFAEVLGMEESSTYQAILRKGRTEGKLEGQAEGAVKGKSEAALLVGQQRFGPPSSRVRKRLSALVTTSALDEALLRIAQFNSWDEVFPPRRRS